MTVRSSVRRFSIKEDVLKKFTMSSENTCVGVTFKKYCRSEGCNVIKKRPQNRCLPVNIAKILKLLISKIIFERLFFYFFNGSLLHQPKGSRSRLYHGVRLQGLIHRSSFLLLSGHERSPSPRPALENLRRIPLINQLSFYIGYF